MTDETREGNIQPSGEEELRFIRNFHDVFLSIGLAMFIVGLGIASSLLGGDVVFGRFDMDDPMASGRAALRTSAAILAVDAAIVWLLAEVFARTRRLFLPAIVILIGFEFFFVSAVGAGYLAVFDPKHLEGLDEAAWQVRVFFLVLTAAALVGALLYYARTKLPFAMGLTGVALAATAVAAAALQWPAVLIERFNTVQLAAGLLLFVLGVGFDARDPERRTRISDNGFWLHFFAAPLIFFGVTRMAGGSPASGGTAEAMATLVIVGAFALVSLLINRRALLVAGLLSAVTATWVLIQSGGAGTAWTAAATLLLLGGAMVLLGGAWHTVRRALTAPFPKSGPLARIIPPEPPRG